MINRDNDWLARQCGRHRSTVWRFLNEKGGHYAVAERITGVLLGAGVRLTEDGQSVTLSEAGPA
ncbi:hypothetical protein JL101_035495 (plasmid) [Skermanella rosea]|uniref:hypothetical protein n=1 Tax=Skermanella rosea TaxID=1817965 RepID=UPI001934A6B0|nr:hypothetical protein [Skermanella rosea]UEM08104.1 hypothetical protein JL101_035495 [Skermanella rosea]